MSPRGKAEQLAEVLDRLEARYGRLVPPRDPVEAGLLALLAMHAPVHATEEVRDRLRAAFVDWNEARVADAFDIAFALEVGSDPAARAFARAALRFLESLHAALNSTSFDTMRKDPQADLAALVEKMRGAPAPVRAVLLAALEPDDGWRASPEMSKVVQKLGLLGKTSSSAKTGKALQEISKPADRLRAHYLLTRYGMREKEEDDPLGASAGARRSAKAGKPKAKPVGKPKANAAP